MSKRQSPPNARFWVWYVPGDCWVKLTLKPGQTLHYSYGGRHEEGYTYVGESYTHEDDRVTSSCSTRSQDCDGRMDTHNSVECSLDDLRSRNVGAEEWAGEGDRGIFAPEWRGVSAGQRDYAAEAMGY